MTHAQRLRLALEQAYAALDQAQQALTAWEAQVNPPAQADDEPEQVDTALSGVMDYLTFLQETEGLSPEAHAYVSDAVMNYLDFLQDAQGTSRASSAKLLSLINDLMQYAQILQGRYEVVTQIVPLRETLQQVHAVLAPRAASKHLDYQIVLDPALPSHVQVDANGLSQVLLELLGNAIKFTPSGHVRMEVSMTSRKGESGVLRVSVADSGVGIDPQDQVRIFEPFVQSSVSLDVTLDEDQAGHGLGLTMVQAMLELQGGQISVVSCLGVGSTFELEWPLRVVESPMEAAPILVTLAPILSERVAAEGDAPVPARAMQILVVDDHQLNRMVALSALKRALPHAQMHEAKNGDEAFEKMSSEHYDLVLMDLVMPDRSGVEVVRAVRSLPSPYRDVRVMALTANVSDEAMADCAAVGMEQVLAKPLDVDLLVKTVLEFVVHPT